MSSKLDVILDVIYICQVRQDDRYVSCQIRLDFNDQKNFKIYWKKNIPSAHQHADEDKVALPLTD